MRGGQPPPGPLLGLLDPRADETEQHTTDDDGEREADQGESQSLEVSHGMVPLSSPAAAAASSAREPGGPQIDDQLKLGRLFDREVGGPVTPALTAASTLPTDSGTPHASRGSSRINRPLRISSSVCSISARVFITKGP